MRYGKVTETIWTDDKFTGLSDVAKLLFIYLLSCSKCNSVGIFQIGLGAIEDDFGHTRDQIKEALAELRESSLAQSEGNWIWFNKFLKWNAPVSPNHARQIAAVLNECVMQDAPASAVCCVLGSVYKVLSALKYKTASGQMKTYWDEFRTTMDVELLSSCVGGKEALKKCIEGTSCPVQSTGKGLVKDSSSTSVSGQSGSTSEVLPKDLATQNKNRQETETYKTRNRTDTNCSGSCLEETTEMSLLCSDGQPHAVGQASVRLIAGMNPDWDFDILRARMQSFTLLNVSERPDPDKLDDFAVALASTFDGERVKTPQKPFSSQKHDSSPLDTESVRNKPCVRPDGESDAEEDA